MGTVFSRQSTQWTFRSARLRHEVVSGDLLAIPAGAVAVIAGIPEQVQAELAARGHRLGAPSAFKGAAQMVRIHRGEAGVRPCLECGVDHRLDGMALGW